MTRYSRNRHFSLNRHFKNPWIGKGNFVMALLLLTSLTAACTLDAGETSSMADNNVTAEEVAEQTEAVEGQTVTIRSEVKQKVGESSFLLDNEGEDILVVNASGAPFLLPDDQEIEVQVTGSVQTFTRVDIERDFDLVLDPEIYAEYETKPALLAKSLALAPDPGEITQNPDQFYNLQIAVEGEVEDVVDPMTFTLDEEQLFGASDLLVIGAPVTDALDGEIVTVTGVLRPFILTEFERDYDLTWDLDIQEKLEAEYSEKPVFVADALYPNAD